MKTSVMSIADTVTGANTPGICILAFKIRNEGDARGQLVLSPESLRTVARTPAEGGPARVDLPLADQPHSRPSPAPSSPGRPPGRERTHL